MLGPAIPTFPVFHRIMTLSRKVPASVCQVGEDWMERSCGSSELTGKVELKACTAPSNQPHCPGIHSITATDYSMCQGLVITRAGPLRGGAHSGGICINSPWKSPGPGRAQAPGSMEEDGYPFSGRKQLPPSSSSRTAPIST